MANISSERNMSQYLHLLSQKYSCKCWILAFSYRINKKTRETRKTMKKRKQFKKNMQMVIFYQPKFKNILYRLPAFQKGMTWWVHDGINTFRHYSPHLRHCETVGTVPPQRLSTTLSHTYPGSWTWGKPLNLHHED